MSIDAIALLRIEGWEPGEDLDVRVLDDGALLYLEVPFESSPEELVDAVVDAVGDVLDRHDDARGVFVLPDVADPDEAQTYEAVLAAVGDAGHFVPLPGDLDPAEATAAMGDGMKSMLDDALAAMGLGNLDDMQRVLRDGDPEALKMMQIKMQGAFEQLQQQQAPAVVEAGGDGDKASGLEPPKLAEDAAKKPG